jgi:hypothetical protein
MTQTVCELCKEYPLVVSTRLRQSTRRCGTRQRRFAGIGLTRGHLLVRREKRVSTQDTTVRLDGIPLIHQNQLEVLIEFLEIGKRFALPRDALTPPHNELEVSLFAHANRKLVEHVDPRTIQEV